MAAPPVTFAGCAHPSSCSLAVGLALFALVHLPSCGDDDVQAPAADAATERVDTPFVIDGGGEPAVPPAGESLCAAGACNYQTQTGCSAQQSCLPALQGGGVVPGCQAAGPGTNGEACSGWNACAKGFFCAEGLCRKLCCGGDWSACPAGESCIRQLLVRNPANSAELPAGVDLCFPVNTCNVLDPEACAETSDRTCQIVDPVGNVACAPRGEAALGQPCSTGSPCVAGASCVGGTCRRLCAAVPGLTASPCPDPEEVCVRFTRDPAGVGECTPRD